jgi:hypothetical protein
MFFQAACCAMNVGLVLRGRLKEFRRWPQSATARTMSVPTLERLAPNTSVRCEALRRPVTLNQLREQKCEKTRLALPRLSTGMAELARFFQMNEIMSIIVLFVCTACAELK